MRSYEAGNRLPFFRLMESTPGATSTIGGKSRIMLGSNNALGLGGDPRLIEAANRATVKYGSSCGGAPPFCGTLGVKVELEEVLADWYGTEAALVYNSGFLANVGAITALVGATDLVYPDSEAHTSIHAGIRLSGASSRFFDHNDLGSLEKNLIRTADRGGTKMIAIDGLYSMRGDVAPMAELVALADRYNVGLFVDEAHSLGVFGPRRTGIAEEYGCLADVDVVMGSMSKAISSTGGFIAGSRDLIDFLRLHSSSHTFTATAAPAALAASLAAVEIIRSPEGAQRAEAVLANARRLRDGLMSHGLSAGSSITLSDGSQAVAPHVSVWIGREDHAIAAWNEVYDNGLFCALAVAPAVGENDSLLRCSVSAAHSPAQIDQAVAVIAAAVLGATS